jgi:signal transduction histidine kinase
VADAERLADPGLLANALAGSVIIGFLSGHGLDEPTLKRALDLEDPDAPVPVMLRPSLISSVLLAWTGHLDQARDGLLSIRRRCLERGEESDLMFAAFHTVIVECWRGNLADARLIAEDTMERALQLGTEFPLAIALAAQANVAAYAGQADETRSAAREALAIFERGSCLAVTVWPTVTLGFLEVSLGDYQAAAATLGPLAAAAPGGISLSVQNPLGVRSLPGPLATVLIGNIGQAWFVFIALMAASTVAMTIRYRSGGRELRQQIKWVAFTAATAIGCSVVVLVSMDIGGKSWAVLTTAADVVVSAIGLAGFPIAIAVAILKYGLYQIDVIITRAVSYGLLSAALTAVYIGIVVGIGTLAGYAGGPVLTVAAAVVVSVLFHPVRQRANLLANRFVYGRRASPYQVLADFAQDMAGQLDADAALDRMAAVLGGATGAERVEVWVLVGAGLSARSVWPANAEPGAAPAMVTRSAGLATLGPVARAIGVYHQHELLGAITLGKAKNEPVSAAEDRLLTDLASQAGLVLRNVRLTAELEATIDDLRASRRRLVQAQDDERQRIERNLHDGAQQQLVALSVQLGLLDGVADDPGEVRALTGRLRSGVRAALDDLRALARGIYPPVLADQGLRAALQAQADRAPMPVLVDADGIGRFSRDAETTLYFCILEALQNVAKYAHASMTTVTLNQVAGKLEFSVADDGAGFNPAAAARGTGLQGMADRLSAVGGQLAIASAPGRGTTISGTVPVAALAPALAD